MFFKHASSVEKQLLNFSNASVSHYFRNLSLTIIWNNLGLSDYKRMERNLEFREKNLLWFQKELISPLLERESSCFDAFVASLNHSMVLGRIFC